MILNHFLFKLEYFPYSTINCGITTNSQMVSVGYKINPPLLKTSETLVNFCFHLVILSIYCLVFHLLIYHKMFCCMSIAIINHFFSDICIIFDFFYRTNYFISIFCINIFCVSSTSFLKTTTLVVITGIFEYNIIIIGIPNPSYIEG